MKQALIILAMYTASHGSFTNFGSAIIYNPTNNTADTVSLKGQWILQPVLASDTATGKSPTLIMNLSSGTFSGNTGCNTMRGSFQKTDTSLVFNQHITTTKMMCTGYNEEAFLKSLLSTNRYKFDNGILVLMFNTTELSRWTRKQHKSVKMNKA